MTDQAALTYRDYEALPNDGRRYELHDGALCVTPAPRPQHQIISMNLVEVLLPHARRDGGLLLAAPLDVILTDTSIVQPDIVYLASDHRHRVSRRGIEGAPTLAVEILSPSTRTIDRGGKTQLYARHHVPFLWLLDPDRRTIEAFALEANRYVLAVTAAGAEPVALPPFPGLALVPETLWP